eukprot:CAMPEP_0170215822 /NCGR_PEP_ID=MMETSP0116_2-20130129/7550_1 /TAXON_ID=400756 /ORGANISM="Durinskia baltica, Strain CSIRO CS-38" /LENGTH=366 /DNA_ID=CAMNT_0010466403 /DNA_START=33 /DNA_END=1133 /DNA_ORIENTATION=-
MGACGSTSSPASSPLPLDAKGARALQVVSMESKMDMSMRFNSEKKTSSKPEGLPGIGFACRRGRKPGTQTPNQDSWALYWEPDMISACGVFDGHGEKGHIVSDYVKQALMRKVLSLEHNEADDVETSVEACYQQVQRSLASQPRLGTDMSGTTATVVVYDHGSERLMCSHVGDSAAVLLKQHPTSERFVAERLTRDHKPNLPDEQERIERHGRVVFDGYCHRVMTKQSMEPGLNMSRSLGDMRAHTLCGVSSTPEVLVRTVTRQDRAILVCSDGVWEVMSPQEAVDIVQRFGRQQAMEAAKSLADEAVRRWLRGTKGRKADDVTVVLAVETCSTDVGPMDSSDSDATNFAALGPDAGVAGVRSVDQ